MGNRNTHQIGFEQPISLRPNPLTRKLLAFVPLTLSDQAVLDALILRREHFDADQDIVCEGSSPASVFVLLDGVAVRYRNLPNGSRQIMTLLIPGDLSDVLPLPGKTMDHAIATITPVSLAVVPRDIMADIHVNHRRIATAFLCGAFQEEAMLRERIVSLGRRDARGRVAYLLCELLWRQTAHGTTTNGKSFKFPLTQTEIGDVLGLTPVHVNRVFKELREQGLVTTEHRTVTLLNVDALKALAELDDTYLNFRGAPADLLRYFEEQELHHPIALQELPRHLALQSEST